MSLDNNHIYRDGSHCNQISVFYPNVEKHGRSTCIFRSRSLSSNYGFFITTRAIQNLPSPEIPSQTKTFICVYICVTTSLFYITSQFWKSSRHILKFSITVFKINCLVYSYFFINQNWNVLIKCRFEPILYKITFKIITMIIEITT